MLYLRYLQINVMAALEYKVALTLTTIGRILSSFLEVVSLFYLFDRFSSLLSYSIGEVGLCYLAIRLSYGFANGLGRGFNAFGRLIRRGQFDALLIRPRSLMLQVFGSDLDLNDFAVVIQYILFLSWFVIQYFPQWTLVKTGVLILMCLSGAIIFFSASIISSALCFFTVKGTDLIQLFTEGGMRLASYPLTIYNKWVTYIFTAIIPFGFVNFLPLRFLSDQEEGFSWLYALSPLAAIFYLIPCVIFWHRCLKFYHSTGS